MNTAIGLDVPDRILRHVARDIEVDTTGVMRALLQVLCDIEILVTRALVAGGRRVDGWGDS